ncbi:MAG TPA: 2-polyprenyl-3-methyl-6-methoxy-1,4-benzoquinone monooxygenase [Steroidobacteraceae bacterium]|nr:2-polyprenyl-3-methyl-6-methoxy-1,4-benzoquinone monooxygenase [Steroidobacteraceae bacterium]
MKTLDLTPLDRLISSFDQALRTVAARSSAARRYPADGVAAGALDAGETRHAAGLMRVNHSGEIAAQALYRGQSVTARDAATRAQLLDAAREEQDHLAWCETRLRELDASPSRLAPLWYAGSFAIGLAAGALNDRVSLGFVAETERQVEGHLEEHLAKLPPRDERSRRILESMQADEIRHGQTATAAGGAPLPAFVRFAMRMTARVMTRTAYWI